MHRAVRENMLLLVFIIIASSAANAFKVAPQVQFGREKLPTEAACAHGFPDSFNALGGFNSDTVGFVEGKSELKTAALTSAGVAGQDAQCVVAQPRLHSKRPMRWQPRTAAASAARMAGQSAQCATARRQLPSKSSTCWLTWTAATSAAYVAGQGANMPRSSPGFIMQGAQYAALDVLTTQTAASRAVSVRRQHEDAQWVTALALAALQVVVKHK
eukprot:CAMPEP_0183357846 /NCGR_PEP_ID=MMETSP0164_2-20130417/47543_1 /TAXON_ID=221442 /ORGANISM="Coccolithus pelagicus ssp braarudi, Strain PLY182g" /LENGTH=214 /DNA_ID=CAMNT_0025531579 /DNA_START=21 /DNA_END=668 /DNA_ORIENTATION=-